MTAEPTVHHRRIAIARARLDAWTNRQRSLELDLGDLEALATAIEEASDALWAFEERVAEPASAERRLRRALEAMRVLVDRVGRAVARRERVEQERIVRTVAGLRLAVPKWRGPLAVRPAITGIELQATGRVRLTFCCPGLEHDPDLCVKVLRRQGQTSTYEPIGVAMGGTFVDGKPHKAGRIAAYKIEIASGPMSGARSGPAVVDLSNRPLPGGWANRHIGRVGPAAKPTPSTTVRSVA